ncbi:hypothetical protein EV127DRAFT_141306 [Xylaria flabelliformis]|nr:hypothetical protein EV127DRAFT_141306 [Xylaria flabelliformis]
MDEGGSYISIDSAVMPSLGKLYLEGRPVASCERLMGNGTACYRGKTPDSDQRNCFLKFKWRWARERPEDELLKVANEASGEPSPLITTKKSKAQQIREEVCDGECIEHLRSNKRTMLSMLADTPHIRKRQTTSSKIVCVVTSSVG